MYFTYILYSSSFDRFYIGQTHDLEQRLKSHNAGMVKSTKHYIPWKLFYYETYESRSQAHKRERFLKNQKNKDFYRKLVAHSAESRELGINHQVVRQRPDRRSISFREQFSEAFLFFEAEMFYTGVLKFSVTKVSFPVVN